MQDINILLEEIRQQYIAEVPSRVDTIESLILNLAEQDNFNTTFEELYRAVHSMKGSAGMHNLHILGTISHHIENNLTEVGANKTVTQVQTNILLKYTDLLRQAIEQIQHNDPGFTDIEKKIAELLSIDNSLHMRALMIESSKTIKNIAQEILHEHSIKIDFCQDGYAALKQLLLENYDLLVTNAEAPVLNGVALIAALKHSEDQKHYTYSVLLTSKDSENKTKRGSDPDFIVQKNHGFIEKFSTVVEQAIEKIKSSQSR